MKIEYWKFIPGYEGYMVSDLGRVKSLNYMHTGKEHVLSPEKIKDDYLRVSLFKGGKVKKILVHRLVWIAFNGPIPDGYEINHINENKQDNRLENLNLMTRKENVNWGTGIRRMAKSHRKLVEQYTLDGTHICTWFSTIGIEMELGYNRTSISNCCCGRYKTSHGFKWCYAS